MPKLLNHPCPKPFSHQVPIKILQNVHWALRNMHYTWSSVHGSVLLPQLTLSIVSCLHRSLTWQDILNQTINPSRNYLFLAEVDSKCLFKNYIFTILKIQRRIFQLSYGIKLETWRTNDLLTFCKYLLSLPSSWLILLCRKLLDVFSHLLKPN